MTGKFRGPAAKLDTQQINHIIDAMRLRYALHPKKLAQRYGITSHTVYHIAKGEFAKRLGGKGRN
jgi:hypothetical protein